jgi:hypothetical protein
MEPVAIWRVAYTEADWMEAIYEPSDRTKKPPTYSAPGVEICRCGAVRNWNACTSLTRETTRLRSYVGLRIRNSAERGNMTPPRVV